jgi:hypothetical protein
MLRSELCRSLVTFGGGSDGVGDRDLGVEPLVRLVCDVLVARHRLAEAAVNQLAVRDLL